MGICRSLSCFEGGVEDEATGMYLCRVPVRQYAPQRPHCLVEEAPDTHVGAETFRVAHPRAHRYFLKYIHSKYRLTQCRGSIDGNTKVRFGVRATNIPLL